MSATTVDRRRVRAVETAMEARVTLEQEHAFDQREDAAREKATAHLRRMLGALREEREFDALGDVKRERAIALVTELAGILDGAEQMPLPLGETA